jgi:RimJ/RimL family protein N-acetyltransferase
LLIAALAERGDPQLYRWTHVPACKSEVARYIDTALAWREAGTAVTFATVRAADGIVLGSTRFFQLEHWAWPQEHARHANAAPDACEIGHTWLTAAAVRTAANTEAKLLMLRFAFEAWHVLRVCFHTDARNERSRNALTRLGAQFEGVLRSHRLAADFTPRNSARFSIIETQWPTVRTRLQAMLGRY